MKGKILLVICCLILLSVGSVKSPSQPPALLWKGLVNGKVTAFEMPVEGVLPIFSNNYVGLDIETGELLWDSESKGWPGDCCDFETDAGVLFTGQGPFAIDPKTGEILWAGKVKKYGSYHAVGYGKLFVTEFNFCMFGSDYRDQTSLMAFDEFTGNSLWTFDAHSVITSDLETGRGLVMFGCEDGTVYALDHETGKITWTVKTGRVVRTKPVVAGDCAFISSDSLYCIDLGTGKLRWVVRNEREVDISQVVWGRPVVIEGKVLSFSGALYCVDAATGSVLWKGFFSPFVVSNKRVYAFTGSGYACLNLEDGTVMWTYEREGADFGEVVVHGNSVIFAASREVVALDASTGEVQWTYDVSEPISCPPLVLDHFIVIGTESAHVIALGTPEYEHLSRCKDLDSAKRLLFKKDYENALKMLQDARALCPEDLYLEIDTLTAYALNLRMKASEIDIFSKVGAVTVLTCSVAILAAITFIRFFLRRKNHNP